MTNESRLLTEEEIIVAVNTYGLAEGGLLISLTEASKREYQGVIEAQDTKTASRILKKLVDFLNMC